MIKKFTVLAMVCSLSASVFAQNDKAMLLKNQIDSVSYAIGSSIGGSLKKDGLDAAINLDVLKAALEAAVKGQSLVLDGNQAQQVLSGYFAEQQAKKGKEAIERGQKFLAENKKRKGVVELPSGLQYEIMKAGTGPKPTKDDKVTTHYHGTTIDGKVFDSSVERGQPAQFGITQVIAGWTEALQLMPVGSKWKLFIPSSLAYGERGAGGNIGPNETLIFEVELISIDKEPAKEPSKN